MKKIIIYVGGFLTAISLLFAVTVSANPSFLQRGVQTNNSIATTSVAYMNPQAPSGTVATSTLTFDTLVNGPSPADSVVALVQFQGSSTASILAVQAEYSQDGIDYYGYSATSTPSVFSDGRATWQFASTTPTDFGSGSGARASRAFKFDVLARFIRVKFYLMPGSQNATLWAELVGKKQIDK